MNKEHLISARRARLAAALAATLTIGLIGVACSSDDDEGSITVYSGRSEELVAPLIEQFEAQSDVDVDVRYGETADLALLIDEEGDDTPADVFFAQSPGAVAFLAGNDRLGQIEAGILEPIDPRFVDADRRWTGVSGRQRVMVYNTDELAPADLPGAVTEVTAGPFEGKVAVAPTNGSFQDFVTAFRTIEGEDEAAAFLDALGEDEPPTYPKNSAIVDAVARGEVTTGLVNHYYALRALAEDASLPVANHRFDAGDVGGLVIPATASLLADAEDSPAATEFIEFLLGEQAQTYFSEETFEYPLRAGVAQSDQLPPLSELQPPTYEFGSLADLQTTARLISESGLE